MPPIQTTPRGIRMLLDAHKTLCWVVTPLALFFFSLGTLFFDDPTASYPAFGISVISIPAVLAGTYGLARYLTSLGRFRPVIAVSILGIIFAAALIYYYPILTAV